MLQPSKGFKDLFTNSRRDARYYSVLFNAVDQLLMRRLLVSRPSARSALPAVSLASDAEKPVKRANMPLAPPAPATQTPEEAAAKTNGCLSCHTASDAPSMHKSDAVVLGCADCHGGDATVTLADRGLKPNDPGYQAVLAKAHVLPRFPKAWHWPSSANPRASYTLLNKESPEFIRFVNPSDYRVVRESCGACHMDTIQAAERSIMASGAMLWGGASYNNGIVPFKNYVFGEAYTRERRAREDRRRPAILPAPSRAEQKARGALPALYPLPSWHVVPPADIFRVFERGGRNINTGFAEVGLPNSLGRSSASRNLAAPISSNPIAVPAPACASRFPCSTSTRRG